MAIQTKEEFLNEIRKTGTKVELITREFNGQTMEFHQYKEPAIGRCNNCKVVKMWQKQKGLKLADVKCGTCGGELKRTTYLCKYPYEANTPVGVEAKAHEFAKKILEE